VTLEGGTRIELETLFWQLPAQALPLLGRLVEDLGLELSDDGSVPCDDSQQTNVPGLYVAGDLQRWAGAVRAAAWGGEAAIHIVKTWY
jgi:thioredoxin reductase